MEVGVLMSADDEVHVAEAKARARKGLSDAEFDILHVKFTRNGRVQVPEEPRAALHHWASFTAWRAGYEAYESGWRDES